MFTEIKNAIDAAEWIFSNLKWSYDSLIREIETCHEHINSGDEDDSRYYKELLEEDLVKVEAYKAVEDALKRFVKKEL